MKNLSNSIRKIVACLNNKEQEGGYWLPNIQRHFVWSEGQVERLFDSLMREYPISTLLIWKTKSNIRYRKFIDNYKHDLKMTTFHMTEDINSKHLILDGQQRLQSLFIGLMGSYDGKELFFDATSGTLVSPEDIRYRFKFIYPTEAKLPWVKFKDIIFSNKKSREVEDSIVALFDNDITNDKKNKIADNISQVLYIFREIDAISYQLLDSVDNPEAYTDDDVVEIFIRANSGGTKLGKSDLLFSLLTSSWDEAEANMETLLEDLNRTGFEFNRDFILKTCLTILKKGAAYNVTKFRDEKNRDAITQNWDNICKAIKDVNDYLYGNTYIRSDKALTSYLILIPVIYFRYHYRDKWNDIKKLDLYILRTLLTGSFSGNPDYIIDQCTEQIDNDSNFIVDNIFSVIRSNNRSLEITENTLLNQAYGSKYIHLIFNLWYKDFNYIPSYENNSPQVDHIFPQSLLRSMKDINPDTGKKNILHYKQEDRDQLSNLMLLTREENGAGGKTDITPEKWFEGKSDDYLEMHLIPRDKTLWTLKNYDRFIEERKNMILDKFKEILIMDREKSIDERPNKKMQ